MIAAPAAVLRAGRNTMQKRQRKHVVVSSCAFSSIQQSRSIALVRKTRRDNVGDNDKTSTSPLSPLRPRPSSVKTEAVAGAKAVAAAAASSSRVPVWLIPDISQADPAAAAAAWAVAGEFSLAQLFARAAAEVGIAFLLARIGVKLLGKLTVESMKRTDAEAEKSTAPLSPLRVALDAAACAALSPARVFFPAIAFAQAVRTATLLLQIALKHRSAAASLAKDSPARALVQKAGAFLGLLDDAALEAAGLAGVVFFAWFAVQFKDRIVSVALSKAAAADFGSAAGSQRAKDAAAAARKAADAARAKGSDEAAAAQAASAAHAASLAASAQEQQHVSGVLERFLIPFAGLATWGIVAVAGCAALGVLGVDPTPLLTVGGFGGLAIGFGAQTVTANAISGLNLYLTRPFVAGERISLLTAAGGVVATGTVERIDIMRCVVRNDAGMPLSIPNRAVGDYIVQNESRLGKGGGSGSSNNASPLAATMAGRPRQLKFKVDLRLEDIDKIEALSHELRAWMSSSADVSKALPFGASLGALTPWSATVGVTAHTSPQGSRRFGAFQAELLTETARAVKRVGAEFAVQP